MSFYFLYVELHEPYGSPIRANIVISEGVVPFIQRNKAKSSLSKTLIVHWWKAISQKQYHFLKEHNPTNEGYWDLKKQDYSHIVEEEEGDEDFETDEP